MDIQEGKTFYQMRITRAGNIYEVNKVNIDTIMGNIEGIFQIRYTIHNLDCISLSYTCLYDRLYVEESNSPYFIKVDDEEYLTLPNKQALMKAVRAQITRYSTYPQSKPIIVINYRDSMRLIKQATLI